MDISKYDTKTKETTLSMHVKKQYHVMSEFENYNNRKTSYTLDNLLQHK